MLLLPHGVSKKQNVLANDKGPFRVRHVVAGCIVEELITPTCACRGVTVVDESGLQSTPNKYDHDWVITS